MLGHFYLDLYTRSGKNGAGFVRALIHRSNLDGKVVYPAAMLNTGIKKSLTFTLLTFKQVKTFFHEFGHLMHNICSRANFTTLSGM
jgi:Zn-dependent oligopeptidase